MVKKAWPAAVIGGVIGAVLGAAGVLSLSQDDETDCTAPKLDEVALRAAVAEALAPLLRDAREWREPIGGRVRRSVAESEASGEDTAVRDAEIIDRVIRISDSLKAPTEPLRPPGVHWTPEPSLARLRELRGFMDEQDVRQRWMFTSEKDALGAFGTPTHVYSGGADVVVWDYDFRTGVDQDGDPIRAVWWRLTFVTGRLAEVKSDDPTDE